MFKIWMLTFLMLFGPGAWAQNSDPLTLLQKAIETDQKNVETISDKIQLSLEDMLSLNSVEKSADVAETQLQEKKAKVQSLIDEKKEQILRLQFLTSLVNQLRNRPLDSSQSAQSIRAALIEISKRDIVGSLETNTSPEIWEFAVNLGIAVKDCLEPMENPATFILDFLNWSTLRNPKSPVEFAQKTRAYRGT